MGWVYLTCVAALSTDNSVMLHEMDILLRPRVRGWTFGWKASWLVARVPGESLHQAGGHVVSRRGTELKKVKAGLPLKGNESVAIEVPDLSPITVEPEAMELDIIHEDELVLIINKPPGMVVHPAVGHRHGTLLSGVLAYLGCSSDTPVADRPALIHRLDADTTGLIAVAKNEAALNRFRRFAAREVEKRYLAVVHGVPQSDYLLLTRPLVAIPKISVRAARP